MIGEMLDGADAGKRFTAITRDDAVGGATIEWLLSEDRTNARVSVEAETEPAARSGGKNCKCWFAVLASNGVGSSL